MSLVVCGVWCVGGLVRRVFLWHYFSYFLWDSITDEELQGRLFSRLRGCSKAGGTEQPNAKWWRKEKKWMDGSSAVLFVCLYGVRVLFITRSSEAQGVCVCLWAGRSACSMHWGGD